MVTLFSRKCALSFVLRKVIVLLLPNTKPVNTGLIYLVRQISKQI